jgi:WGR domain
VTAAPFDKYDFETGRMIELRRVDASQNMRRFYRLDIVPDLFGGFLLMKQWGRIGARGQIARSYNVSRWTISRLKA